MSRLRKAINPESGSTIYTYREDGSLQTRTDARLVKLTNSYNPLGQLQGQTYEEVGALPDNYLRSPVAGYEYGTAAPNDGRLTKVYTNGVVSKQYGYDPLGRTLTSAQITDGQSYPFVYTYDADDLEIRQRGHRDDDVQQPAAAGHDPGWYADDVDIRVRDDGEQRQHGRRK